MWRGGSMEERKVSHAKKIIAPVIITVLLVLYFLSSILLGWHQSMPGFARVINIVASLGLIGMSIFVLLERIKEIRSGEEDDLSKY